MNYLSSRPLARFVSLVLLAAFPVFAEASILDQGSNLMLRSRDMNFAMRLAQSAAGAEMIGNQISSRSGNSAVQSFGRQMASDYTKMQAGLRAIVTPMRVTLPDEVPANELSTLVKVENSTPARLDKTYLKASLKQTVRTIKYFKAEIKKGHNPAIQKFAIETLPVLEDHLEKARSLYRATEKKT